MKSTAGDRSEPMTREGLFRYLDRELGLAFRPEHARAITATLLQVQREAEQVREALKGQWQQTEADLHELVLDLWAGYGEERDDADQGAMMQRVHAAVGVVGVNDCQNPMGTIYLTPS